MEKKLPEWVKTSEDYELWKRGFEPSVQSSTRKKNMWQQTSLAGKIGAIAIIALVFFTYFGPKLPKTSPPASGSEAILRGGYFGCVTEDLMKTVTQCLKDDDRVTIGRLLRSDLCVMLRPGIRVTILSIDSEVAGVRADNGTIFWTDPRNLK